MRLYSRAWKLEKLQYPIEKFRALANYDIRFREKDRERILVQIIIINVMLIDA